MDWLLAQPPRPVQLEANKRSYPLSGYALFMEMRLGKTAALFNEYLLFKRDYGVKKLLIISPNKYKYAWREEARKFGIVDPICVFESARWRDAIGFGGFIMVINYEALQSDNSLKVFKKFSADMIVADESILIKNRTTHAFKRGLELAKEAKVVRILTGKPIVQGPHDLWSQLRFINQINGFNYYSFRNTFCKMGGFLGKQVVGVREDNLPKLKAILDECSFTAARADWMPTFESDYETRSIDISPEQKLHYREMEQDFITFLKSGQPITADQVLTKHLKLQQISSGFVIDENKKVHDILPMEKLPKLKDLKYSLENEVSHKALVICYYVHSLEVLLMALAEYQPALIGGNILMKRLGKDVEKEKKFFNEDPRCKVLIAQVSAVKYGHNLMGTKADPCLDVFYYENTYSLDDRSQSEQRPQGEGQVKGLRIVDFVSTSVEKAIVKALQRKENVSRAIMKAY